MYTLMLINKWTKDKCISKYCSWLVNDTQCIFNLNLFGPYCVTSFKIKNKNTLLCKKKTLHFWVHHLSHTELFPNFPPEKQPSRTHIRVEPTDLCSFAASYYSFIPPLFFCRKVPHQLFWDGCRDAEWLEASGSLIFFFQRSMP